MTVLGDDPVPPENLDAPCTYRPGHVDEFFRLIERGMTPTQLAGSDSHGNDLEAGFPRAYFRSSTDSPRAITVGEAVESLRGGHAFASYGPFIRASVGGKTFGDIASGSPGQTLELELEVQTASWFGVDRVEVYLNGRQIRLVQPTEPPTAIVDTKGKVTFEVPQRDSWIVVIALGLEDQNLMSAVYLDVPWSQLELSRIASDAFSRVPAVSAVFPPPPAVANWGPAPAFAVTNPIYIDTDGNGRYDPSLPFPEFCSRACDPARRTSISARPGRPACRTRCSAASRSAVAAVVSPAPA